MSEESKEEGDELSEYEDEEEEDVEEEDVEEFDEYVNDLSDKDEEPDMVQRRGHR